MSGAVCLYRSPLSMRTVAALASPRWTNKGWCEPTKPGRARNPLSQVVLSFAFSDIGSHDEMSDGTPAPAPAHRALVRAPATWYSWLLIGAYIYLLNVQGNVVPFLQDEFALSYGAVSFHSSAIAVGIILVGLFGERVTRGIGRRKTLWLGVGGLAAGAVLLCLSPAPWASISSCFVMGIFRNATPRSSAGTPCRYSWRA